MGSGPHQRLAAPAVVADGKEDADIHLCGVPLAVCWGKASKWCAIGVGDIRAAGTWDAVPWSGTATMVCAVVPFGFNTKTLSH